jgi:hypothetical protein
MVVLWVVAPCSLIVYRLYRDACCLNQQNDEKEVREISACILIALMREAASTFETSVNFYQTTRRKNPQDSHLQLAAVRNGNLTAVQTIKIKWEEHRRKGSI